MNYITILDFMVSDLGLKGNELIVFALIYGFCQDGSSKFYGSFSYIQERTGISNFTVNDCLKKLVEKDYLVKEKEYIKGVNICSYSLSEKILGVMRKPHSPYEETSFRGYEKTSHNNTIYINKIDNKNIYSATDEETKNIVTEIIKYLNKKADKTFKVESKSHREHIEARLKDGYTVKDFKYVIDIKVSEWKGTNMDKYLRPKTLFTPTNFENYLNQKEEYIQRELYNKEQCKTIEEEFPEL